MPAEKPTRNLLLVETVLTLSSSGPTGVQLRHLAKVRAIDYLYVPQKFVAQAKEHVLRRAIQ
jgi:hypothetical protein